MGPRLGRVEYESDDAFWNHLCTASMGPRLGRVEYRAPNSARADRRFASMGPRLGRVEYAGSPFDGGVPVNVLQWGHA